MGYKYNYDKDLGKWLVTVGNGTIIERFDTEQAVLQWLKPRRKMAKTDRKIESLEETECLAIT